MYSGHYAAGLVLKARVPEAPTWAILLGTTVLDLLWAPFVAAGWEVWTRSNVQIGWSHSLAMAAFWGVLYGLLFLRRGTPVAIVMALAVFSHFVMDFLVHERHLTYYPGSAARFGTGLGLSPWGPGWLLELAVILACGGYYLWMCRKDARYGRHAGALVAVLVGLHVVRASLGM